MVSRRFENVIHFHNLGQHQLNELLKASKQFNLSCCYLGHQQVGEQDVLLISSTTKLSDLKKIRNNFKNWIYLIIENPLNGELINELNEIGKIYYLDFIDIDKIMYRFELLSNSFIPLAPHHENSDHHLAIISHDFKNPLNAIRLDAQILLRKSKKENKLNLSEDVKQIVGRIIKTTDRLGLLVNDLLDHKKTGNALVSLTRHSVHMESVVDEVIEVIAPIAKRNSVKIKKIIDSDIPTLLADKNKLFQVILNLISNAIKFSYQHTSIYINLSSREDKIIFSVEDSGPGIDPEIEPNLYERFRAGKSKECGSGLGLYICKTIVEAHQGKISHCPGKKGGAVFEFYLPLEMKVLEQSKKVYLIDDDEDLRDVLSWALNSEGIHVESFSSPLSALDYLSVGKETPSVILSDFKNSLMAKDFIKKRSELKLQNVPLLFMTTSPDEVIREIDESHFKEVLAKPLDLDSFIQTVSRYVDL